MDVCVCYFARVFSSTDSSTQTLLLFFRRAMQTGEALHIGDDDDDDEEDDDED